MRKGSKYKFILVIEVSPEKEEEFNEWYNTEHIPRISKVPGILGASRYVSASGEPKYLTVYAVETPDVPKSEAIKEAANTEWTKRLKPHYHVIISGVYKKIYPEE